MASIASRRLSFPPMERFLTSPHCAGSIVTPRFSSTSPLPQGFIDVASECAVEPVCIPSPPVRPSWNFSCPHCHTDHWFHMHGASEDTMQSFLCTFCSKYILLRFPLIDSESVVYDDIPIPNGTAPVLPIHRVQADDEESIASDYEDLDALEKFRHYEMIDLTYPEVIDLTLDAMDTEEPIIDLTLC